MKNKEHTCLICKRVIVGKSKRILCDDCINKYGSAAACLAVTGLAVGGKVLLRNVGRFLKYIPK